MEKKTDAQIIRESLERLDHLDEFKFDRGDILGFGKKPAPAPEQEDDAATRRLGDVKKRADDEKKGFGFFRSLRDKAFGKKAPAATPEPFSRDQQSPEDRRAAVIARAKKD